MTLRLDRPVVAGEIMIAALSEYDVRASLSKDAVWAPGWKRPVAILIRRGAQIDAFDPSGTPLDFNELERRHAGLRKEFEHAISLSEPA